MRSPKFAILRGLLLVILALVVLAGCDVQEVLEDLQVVTGSGNVVTREFDLSGFDQVGISAAFRGTITQGDAYRVVVRVDENLEQYLQVAIDGDRLDIGFTPNVVVNRGTTEYEITMPALSGVVVSGAGIADLAGFQSSERFSAEASGASRIEGDVSSGDANLVASGASTIRLSGSGGKLQANASGASTIDVEQFMVTDANVEASGASRINVNASGSLDAEASGASTVQYAGNPALGNINESGGSTIQAR